MSGEYEKNLSRREVLRVLGVYYLGVFIASCAPEKSSETGFTYEQKGPNGRSEVFLPLGETHPETGRYTLHLSPEVLIKNPLSVDSVIKHPEFRIEVTMIAQDVNRLLIHALVGRAEEEVARDGWEGVVNNPELAQAHILTASWKDWEFQEVTWDGNILLPQSDVENL